MSNATLKQAGKIISVFEDISTERMQAILASGLLADLRDGDISRIDREKFRRDLALDLESLEFLKLISGSKELIIDECDGSKVFTDANDIFRYLGSDSKNWDANKKELATKKTPVAVYEIVKDGNFAQLFTSLSGNVRRLCFTQHQIKNFAEKYRNSNWFQMEDRSGTYGTFFLLESKDDLLVACVYLNRGGRLKVFVRQFNDKQVWFAVNHEYFVVPQLV